MANPIELLQAEARSCARCHDEKLLYVTLVRLRRPRPVCGKRAVFLADAVASQLLGDDVDAELAGAEVRRCPSSSRAYNPRDRGELAEEGRPPGSSRRTRARVGERIAGGGGRLRVFWVGSEVAIHLHAFEGVAYRGRTMVS